MPQTDVKYFTPREASKTLPLVRQIVRDILTCANTIKNIADLSEGQLVESEETKNLSAQIEKFISELEEIGCSYKGWSFEIGIVDFPSVINGEDILLCWRSDEDDIRFFHGLLDGFAGRKPIPEEYL